MGTLLDLANRLEKTAGAVDKAASDAAVTVALTIVGDLAFKTPVDTSKALSNWIVTLDSPSNATIKPHFGGKKGSSYRSSAAETIALAKKVLASKKPGQSIFITNSLPYIKRLNEGSSEQAPAGFVERAVLIGRKTAKKNFKIKIKG